MPKQKKKSCQMHLNASPNMITNLIMLSATVAIRVLSAPLNTLYYKFFLKISKEVCRFSLGVGD